MSTLDLAASDVARVLTQTAAEMFLHRPRCGQQLSAGVAPLRQSVARLVRRRVLLRHGRAAGVADVGAGRLVTSPQVPDGGRSEPEGDAAHPAVVRYDAEDG